MKFSLRHGVPDWYYTKSERTLISLFNLQIAAKGLLLPYGSGKWSFLLADGHPGRQPRQPDLSHAVYSSGGRPSNYVMRDRLFLISGILGIGALVMTLILARVGPRATGPLPDGFITPVVAFEFAESAAEVTTLFEPGGSAAAMDRLNRWDFLFMALYSLFLGTFALAAARQFGQPVLYIAAALAPLILLADVMENVQLLSLTAQLNLGGNMEPALDRLHLFTWLKWGGLAAYFLLLIPYFRRLDGRWRFVWLAAALPALAGGVALISRGLANELLALSIGLMFVLLTVYAVGSGSVRQWISELVVGGQWS